MYQAQTSVLLAAALVAALAPATLAQRDGDDRRQLWADDMARFQQQDEANPPAAGGVLFVGSSSIRLWDLAESFPDLDPPPTNRGFGGSQLIDSVEGAEFLILKHKPRLVVVYAGDNDIAAGKDAQRVLTHFRLLVAMIHQNLPETHVAYIAIKPSIARWKLADEMKTANEQIAKLCQENEQLTFIDVWQPMLGDDGKPREELFRDDGLHLNDQGYELWTSLVAPVIKSVSATHE